MRISIRGPRAEYNISDLSVTSVTTVAELRNLILNHLRRGDIDGTYQSFRPEDVRLIFGGRVLSDADRTLGDYQVSNDAVVNMVLSMAHQTTPGQNTTPNNTNTNQTRPGNTAGGAPNLADLLGGFNIPSGIRNDPQVNQIVQGIIQGAGQMAGQVAENYQQQRGGNTDVGRVVQQVLSGMWQNGGAQANHNNNHHNNNGGGAESSGSSSAEEVHVVEVNLTGETPHNNNSAANNNNASRPSPQIHVVQVSSTAPSSNNNNTTTQPAVHVTNLTRGPTVQTTTANPPPHDTTIHLHVHVHCPLEEVDSLPERVGPVLRRLRYDIAQTEVHRNNNNNNNNVEVEFEAVERGREAQEENHNNTTLFLTRALAEVIPLNEFMPLFLSGNNNNSFPTLLQILSRHRPRLRECLTNLLAQHSATSNNNNTSVAQRVANLDAAALVNAVRASPEIRSPVNPQVVLGTLRSFATQLETYVLNEFVFSENDPNPTLAQRSEEFFRSHLTRFFQRAQDQWRTSSTLLTTVRNLFRQLMDKIIDTVLAAQPNFQLFRPMIENYVQNTILGSALENMWNASVNNNNDNNNSNNDTTTNSGQQEDENDFLDDVVNELMQGDDDDQNRNNNNNNGLQQNWENAFEGWRQQSNIPQETIDHFYNETGNKNDGEQKNTNNKRSDNDLD